MSVSKPTQISEGAGVQGGRLEGDYMVAAEDKDWTLRGIRMQGYHRGGCTVSLVWKKKKVWKRTETLIEITFYSYTGRWLQFIPPGQKAVCTQHLSSVFLLPKHINGIVPAKAQPWNQYHRTRAGKRIENKSKIGMASMCHRTVKTLVGFGTLSVLT